MHVFINVRYFIHAVPETPQVMITPYYFNDTRDLRMLNISDHLNVGGFV